MPSTTPDTIISTLAHSPHTMTTAEIADASGLADRAVRDAIAALVDSGRVVKHRTGRTLHWGLRGQPLPPRQPIVLTADPVKLDAAERLQRDHASLRRDYEALTTEYDALRVQYDDLRQQFESLRRPFSVGDMPQWSDVWDFDPVPAYPGKHPCEKPLTLLSHIIAASSRPGALVLDAFAGSGSTGHAALMLGRRFIGIERDPAIFDQACERLSAFHSQLSLI